MFYNTTKDILGGKKLTEVLEVTSEISLHYSRLMSGLPELKPELGGDSDWIKCMCYLGNRGEKLIYLDGLLPIPVGMSLENLLEEPKLINLVQAYILGFSNYCRESYKKYIKMSTVADNPKSLVDVDKEKYYTNSKYLRAIKDRYIKELKQRKSINTILENESSGDF